MTRVSSLIMGWILSESPAHSSSNLDETHRLQGGSTITQQLARDFFLTAEPPWRRKLSEALIALILELRLTKEQIFTMYANEVYLGQRGSFAIHGFDEQFGKDLPELTLQASTLARIITGAECLLSEQASRPRDRPA